MDARSIRFFAASAWVCIAGAVHATPATAPHAAECVAALKAREASLAESVKAGAAVQPELLDVVRSGIAIIGTQYLAGLREAEARQLLQAAEQDFQTLPPSAAQTRQEACQREGQMLYRDASPLEQALITNSAQRRIKRLTAA
jgi:hypothetical protein